MACEEKVYEGVDAEKMKNIRIELGKLGLQVPETDTGKITSAQIGVEADFTWNPETQIIKVKVLEKPFFLPCAFIYSRLEQTINQDSSG
ncbi:MAG TPA: hypothetical protein ENJ82_07690 [Bacteroidetes bacterium]|nr:hypothetical protein [Bacteroidota bacterium]